MSQEGTESQAEASAEPEFEVGSLTHPFGQIQLPILVRLINGAVLEASQVQRSKPDTCWIVPIEGPGVYVDALWIFTIESATGVSLTSYVLQEGHSVP